MRGRWCNIIVLNEPVRRKVMIQKAVLFGITAGFLYFA